MKKLYLWVWESVLEDYSFGIAFAFAADEAGAWKALKKKDPGAWNSILGTRPRKVTTPEGFACWGGG